MRTSNWPMKFCPQCGALLSLDASRRAADCAACGFAAAFDALGAEEAVYASDARTLVRRYGVEPMLPNGQRALDGREGEEKRQRATVDETCPKCGHQGLDYYTMQLRSVDEGQTVFYECPKCKHKWSQNN